MRTIQLQKVFSLILSAVIILAACQTQSQSQSPSLSATLKELSGTVNIKQAGAADFVKASGGETLNQDGSVKTGDDGRVRL
ncbi:MAG TPA: hypothetical protein VHM28_11335, partial [Anaerolineales bacterium]|nr:hypothetical protein [Anaerolineales bacterium]